MSGETMTVLGATVALCLLTNACATRDRAVEELVARNVAARGGAEACRAVTSLRLTGEVDVGQELLVPYVLEQKRPDKQCFELEFDGAVAVQCSDGRAGWKLEPFRGRAAPEPMTEEEVREVADQAEPCGLLFDHARRGHEVKLVGRETVAGRERIELEVTLPGGAVRWVFLDAETALEVAVEAARTIGGRERRVRTVYDDWKPAGGVLLPRRQETRTEGSDEGHVLTVRSVEVDPLLDDARFERPGAAPGRLAGSGSPRQEPRRTPTPRAR